MNFLIEVHSKDNQVEHYLVLSVKSEAEAGSKLHEYFRDCEYLLAPTLDWSLNDTRYQFYIFRIVELKEDKPVQYVAGEYRSQFPL